MRATSWVAVMVAVALVACSDDDGGCADGCVKVTCGAQQIVLRADPWRLDIERADGVATSVLLADPQPSSGAAPRGIAFRRARADVTMRFGSFHIQETGPDGGPLPEWQRVVAVGAATAVEPADPGVTSAHSYPLLGKDGAVLGTLTVTALARCGTYTLDVTPNASLQLNRASIGARCHPGEHFIGLGGQSFDVDHRGQTVPLWVSEDGITKKTDDVHSGDWSLVGRRHSTHTPMPITLSSRSVSFVLDTPTYAKFAVCSEQDDLLRMEAWQGTLRLHVFAGADPIDTLARQSEMIGRPRSPPAWAFAPWLDAMYGPDNVRRVAQKLRSAGVASAAIWSEDWRGGTQHAGSYTLDEDWNLDTVLYPDAETLVTDLRTMGFAWLTYNNTFLSQKGDVWQHVLDNGFTIKTADGSGPYLFDGADFAKTSLLDLTNPQARAWAKEVMRQSLTLGAGGWMADFAEWMPTDCALHDGSDPMAHHNRYPVDYMALNRELLNAWIPYQDAQTQWTPEPLFFSRSAWLGAQPLASIVWAGDQQTDFSLGDGMPSVIPMGIGLGVTGFPFFGHDIGGYMSTFTKPTTKELWFRWVTLGALSPIMRTHHGRAAFENWNWESDEESTAHFARWARLHMRLLPTLLALVEAAVSWGTPMLRPLALDWPAFEKGWTATDVFALGPSLIVAPVVEQGATSRTVTLPAGPYHLLVDDPDSDDELGLPAAIVSDGVTPITVAAPMTELPVFVPGGALLVVASPALQTPLASTLTADDPAFGEGLEVWIYRGPQQSQTASKSRALYQGSGWNLHWWSMGEPESGLPAGALSASEHAALLDGAKWTPDDPDGPAMVRDGAVLEVQGSGRLFFKGPGLRSSSLDVVRFGSGSLRLRVRLR